MSELPEKQVGRSGPEEGRPGRRGEVRRDGALQGAPAADGLRARRMLPGRDEKGLPHRHRRLRGAARHDRRQCGPNRPPAQDTSGGAAQGPGVHPGGPNLGIIFGHVWKKGWGKPAETIAVRRAEWRAMTALTRQNNTRKYGVYTRSAYSLSMWK